MRHRTSLDRDYDQRRGSAASRGYDHRWHKLRRMVLAAEPLCRICHAQGRRRLAAEVDHIVPLVEGGERLDESNTQPLCKPCHVLKSAVDRRRRQRRG